MNEHNGRPAIELRQVHKAFGPQTVLKGVDLTVRPRETLAVLGKSGAGKSVLLKLIIGLQKPDAGTIEIHGQATADLPPDAMDALRMKVGYLFQEGALYDSLTLEENVAFPLRHHQDQLSEADLRKRAHELLAVVGLEKDAAKRPAEISGGMKKRAGLARALALEPDILLFDEPTSGLDPITAGEIEALMLKLKKEREMASVLVTHDVHGARAVADRVALINDGAIVAEGTFEELAASRDPFVSQFLGKDR
ncbi:MAG TPA: ABC transporter ATP-binding protein [Vicinamibacterales bacterium]|nr:ABC transporter ATP-binding protein [Vicinamibacterales bacterium]